MEGGSSSGEVRVTSTSGAEASAPARVRKRDGREVAFDSAKIVAAIGRAMAAVGEDDLQFAREVAHVVQLTLAQRQERAKVGGEGAPPEIEAIQDLVEQALIDLGRGRAAKAYILYRERRARIREVLALQPGQEDASGEGVRVRDKSGVRVWSKGRIVAALLDEADLPRGTAEEVASRVERRVLDSGLTRVTTALVRELVAGELMDMGLTGALRRQGTVGVPRHDLRRVLACTALEPWGAQTAHLGAAELAEVDRVELPAGPELSDVESIVAGEVLLRLTLEDVLGDELAAMHVSGDLSVEDLGAPHRPLQISLPSELLTSGEPGARAAFELLDSAAELLRATTRGLVLEEPGAVLVPLARATRPGSPAGLSAWLRSLAATSRAAGRRVDLGSPGSRCASFTRRLVEELAQLVPAGRGAWTPRLYLDGPELEQVAEVAPGAVESCLGAGLIVPTWSQSGERFAGPGCRRRPRERTAVACGGAVCLNLPRVARRCGPWREDLVLEALSGLVQFAVDASQRVGELQEQHAAARSVAALGGVRVRSVFALVPIGMREALRILGDGELDLSQGARLLGFLGEAARRHSLRSGVELVPSTFFGARAAARFAWLDAGSGQDMPSHQHRLFSEPGAPDGERPYSTGLLLGPCSGYWQGEPEGELAAMLPAGALQPFPAASARSRAGGEAPERLAIWRAFHRARTRAGEEEPGCTLFPLPRVALQDGPSAESIATPSDPLSVAATPEGVAEPDHAPSDGGEPCA